MTESGRELRVEDPSASVPEILRTFDTLAPGQATVIVSTTDLAPVLRRFQSERARQFEWNVLEVGPSQFRVEIVRRSDGAPRDVTEYLETDHRRLDALLTNIAHLSQAASFPAAAARFAEFACGLNRHIDAEESILFPAFERMTGMAGGPTVVMRMEHVEIRRGMDAVSQALAARDPARCAAAIDALGDSLSSHNMKEEHILYPTTDRVAGSEAARDELVTRLQAV